MKPLLTLCFLLLTLTSCEGPMLWYPAPPIVRDYDSDAFTNVTEHQAAIWRHRHRWYLEDSWVYYDAYGIVNCIKLQYRTQNLLELQEARALLVDLVEEYLELLDVNPDTASKVEPGFSADNLLVYVDLQSYWGLYGDPQLVGWMVLEDGMVYYYDFDVKNNDVDYWYSRIESYNKSKEIVRLERLAEEDYENSLPLSETKAPSIEDVLNKPVEHPGEPNKTSTGQVSPSRTVGL
jgi:hypothetical protein